MIARFCFLKTILEFMLNSVLPHPMRRRSFIVLVTPSLAGF